MASSTVLPVGALATAIVGQALPPAGTEVETSSPTMRPWEVLASQLSGMGPAMLVAVPQLALPFVEDR
jgi:hypothetical protein